MKIETLNTDSIIILCILTLGSALLLTVESWAASTPDAIFLGAGVAFAGYTLYRIIRGIIQPEWLDAETQAGVDTIDPTHLEEGDTEDDTYCD